MIADNQLLEYATFNGNSYGTPRSYVEQLVNEGKDVILEIEIQGALQVKKLYPEALLLFVMPPSADALKERLVINDQIENSVEQVHAIISCEHFKTARNEDTIDMIQKDLKKFEGR